MESRALIRKLKKDLKGKTSEAARVIGVSEAHVSRVLSGKRENLDLLGKLIDFRNNLIEEQNRLMDSLRKKMETVS